MAKDAEMINRVLEAVHFGQLVSGDEEGTYRAILKAIHPDKSSHPLAADATAKVLKLYGHFKNGRVVTDDSGDCCTNDCWLRYMGDNNIVDYGRTQQQLVYNIASPHLRKYMPYAWESGQKLVFQQRSLPLVGLSLPQAHVNWVVSRLLEFCMQLHRQTNQVHMGLVPNHVFVIPETHGIAVTGFYHLTPTGKRLNTISAAWKHWYPDDIFQTKTASEYADLEMVKRIGAYLLGDQSGLGTALIRTHNRDFVDFLLTSDHDSVECYDKYRALLDKNFPNQFIHLNI